jgi:hypothetical protein
LPRLDAIFSLMRWRVSRRHPGLHQHLLLPIARALAIVRFRAFLGDADFAAGSIRPQPQIYAIALAFRGVRRKQRGVLVGHLLVEFLVAQRLRAVSLAVARIHEHQVDIGTVVQLFPAQFPQRDYGEAAGRPVGKPRLAVPFGQFLTDTAVRHGQNAIGEAR